MRNVGSIMISTHILFYAIPADSSGDYLMLGWRFNEEIVKKGYQANQSCTDVSRAGRNSRLENPCYTRGSDLALRFTQVYDSAVKWINGLISSHLREINT